MALGGDSPPWFFENALHIELPRGDNEKNGRNISSLVDLERLDSYGLVLPDNYRSETPDTVPFVQGDDRDYGHSEHAPLDDEEIPIGRSRGSRKGSINCGVSRKAMEQVKLSSYKSSDIISSYKRSAEKVATLLKEKISCEYYEERMVMTPKPRFPVMSDSTKRENHESIGMPFNSGLVSSPIYLAHSFSGSEKFPTIAQNNTGLVPSEDSNEKDDEPFDEPRSRQLRSPSPIHNMSCSNMMYAQDSRWDPRHVTENRINAQKDAISSIGEQEDTGRSDDQPTLEGNCTGRIGPTGQGKDVEGAKMNEKKSKSGVAASIAAHLPSSPLDNNFMSLCTLVKQFCQGTTEEGEKDRVEADRTATVTTESADQKSNGSERNTQEGMSKEFSEESAIPRWICIDPTLFKRSEEREGRS